MKRLVVLISLLSVLAASLGWAGDAHVLGGSDAQVMHHSQSDPDSHSHPASLGECHVFHCQALVHLSSLPPAQYSLPAPAVSAAALSTLAGHRHAGFLTQPWRPPSV